MRIDEYEAFSDLMSQALAFWRRDVSDFSLSVWWQALKPYDLLAVRDALGRHAANPDGGHFGPEPADIIKMLDGGGQDSALMAWAKVDRAMRHVGTYRSVVFDDPLIHRVVHEMGGWVALGLKKEDEWPFLRNEFSTRYRGYRVRSLAPDYPPVLIGIADAENGQRGFGDTQPVLIGAPDQARLVMERGSNRPMLQITQAALPVAIEAKEEQAWPA